MNCPVCGASSRNRFCPVHERAYQNLLVAYEAWHRALEVSWRDYLERVNANSNSGIWVRDVCVFLLRNGTGDR